MTWTLAVRGVKLPGASDEMKARQFLFRLLSDANIHILEEVNREVLRNTDPGDPEHLQTMLVLQKSRNVMLHPMRNFELTEEGT